ncbi:MAG: fibronectin type III domain-containing protein, partial [Paludibacter sp.]
MKTFYNNLKFSALLFSLIGISTAQLFAQTSISAIGSTYTQDFNTLISAGSWTDNSTIANWYTLDANLSPSTTISLNDGNGLNGGLTSYGSIGSPDRALGFFPAGSIGDKMYVGWRFKNTMPLTTINSLVITWTGEQWRDEDTSPQNINLVYQISSSAITSIDPLNLQSASMLFSSPQNTGAQISLNGNLVANRATNTHVINEPIAPGSEIIVVWETTDLNPNHLMAIDDISVTAKASQTITFGTPVTKTYGDASFSSGATSSSGLTVSLVSSNTLVATVSGGNITIVGPGKSNITASQSGNGSYDAALDVVRTLSVKPKVPITIEATNISTTSFQANWTADNGLNDAGTTYTVQYANNASFTGAQTKVSSVKNVTINSLSPNTIYYYKVYAINNTVASSYNVASAITTGSDYITANTGNWDTGTNWNVGYINDIANSITIQHAITLDNARASVTTNSLVLKTSGKLTSNQIINVLNELVIEVDATGANVGQLLNTGSINLGLNAKVIVRKSFTANQWNFMGFPFNVASSTVFAQNGSTPLTWFDLGGSGDYVVQEYDGSKRNTTGLANTSGAGLNWINVPGRTFIAKKGYIIACSSSRVIDFTLRGENKADIFSISGSTATLGQYDSNPSVYHRSWNLVTSPYLSSFELATTVNNAPYYAYNGVNYTTKLSGETLIVPPFRSFFLQALSSSISFGNIGKRLNAPTAKETQAEVDDIYLKLSNGNSIYDDETRIRLQDGASSDYVIGQDAAKMFGMDSNVSYIYSTINGFGAAINTLPRTISSVELQTRFAAIGNYSISINNTDKVNN